MSGINGIKILVMDRGHIKIARVEPHPDLAFWLRLTNARVIRRWGTTRGLAQLKNGPTDATQLDDPHTGAVPFRAILDIIDVEEEKWEQHLPNGASSAHAKRTRMGD